MKKIFWFLSLTAGCTFETTEVIQPSPCEFSVHISDGGHGGGDDNGGQPEMGGMGGAEDPGVCIALGEECNPDASNCCGDYLCCPGPNPPLGVCYNAFQC